MKEDSTTFIQFNDSIHYKGVWAIHRNDENTEYVTIEFAGNPNYYYLKDSQLYHSEREMINNIWDQDTISELKICNNGILFVYN